MIKAVQVVYVCLLRYSQLCWAADGAVSSPAGLTLHSAVGFHNGARAKDAVFYFL